MDKKIDADSIKKIAIVRVNALGDLIFLIPAINAIRNTFKRAELVYIGKSWHKDFVPGRINGIDRVIVAPHYPGVGIPETFKPNVKELDEFFKSMKSEHFDIAIQMHGGGKNSNPFTKRLGARMSIGFQDTDAIPMDITLRYVLYQNEFMRYLELVSMICAKIKDVEPEINILKEDTDEMNVFLSHFPPKKYIVLHPGASDPRRHWPAENFGTLAKYYINKGYEVFVTGSDSESKIVQAVLSTEPRARNACDTLSLGGLAALLKNSELVVSNDTGPMHLALALGAKTVGIYWAGNMIIASHPFRKIHRPVFSWNIKCPICGRPYVKLSNKHPCGHDTSLITDISVEAVIKEADGLLAEQ